MFPRFVINPGATIFTIGSCFARHIEDHLQQLGFDVPMLGFTIPPSEYTGNRVGILNRFTPTAMHQEIEWGSRIFLAGGTPTPEQLTECLLDMPDGRCVDVHLGGLFHVAPDSAIKLRHELGTVVAQAFTADVVVITMGLIETWWDRVDSRFIQRIPTVEMVAAFPGRFALRRLTFEECMQRMREMLTLLRTVGNPHKRFLVTTSPVPMFRTFTRDDALIANTYSKSLLRTVAGCLAEESPDVDYFPSYESVTLSSNRSEVWHDDQLHVTDAFIGKIVRRLMASYLPGSVSSGLAEAESELRANRPARAVAILEGLDSTRSNDDFERMHLHRIWVRALTCLQRIAEIAPHLDAMTKIGVGDALIARELAIAWSSIGHTDRAFDAIENLVVDEEDPAGIRLWRARLLQQLKRFPEALDEYRRHAAHGAPSSEVHAGMGQVAECMGDLQEAEAHFKAAYELGTLPRAVEGLVRILLHQRRSREALELVEAAKTRNPGQYEFDALLLLIHQAMPA